MPAYIKFSDIKGENARPQSSSELGTGGAKSSQYTYQLKNVIVTSYSIAGSSAPEPGTTKTGVAGRGTLKVNRPTSAYPSPFRAIATGSRRLESLTLVDETPGHGLEGTCTFTLSGVEITEAATKNNALPTEEISLTYQKIDWTYSTGAKNV